MQSAFVFTVCFTLICIVCGQLIQRKSVNEGSDDDGLGSVFLQASRAKSVLRRKRGWWLGENEEESESDERTREAKNRKQMIEKCQASCWGSWGQWSMCSVPCGYSGSRTRSRPESISSTCKQYITKCNGATTSLISCNRACWNGGILQANHCICKAGFKGVCCKERVRCGFPGKPSNGVVSTTESTHDPNTVVRYFCVTGYKLEGSNTRRCLDSGDWSGSLPTCKKIICPDPGTPLNGRRTGKDMAYESRLVFECNTGYVMQGTNTITCKADSTWTAAVPLCHAAYCPRPEDVVNGWMKLPSKLRYNQVVTYGCNAHYFLEGSSERTCGANGQWNGVQPTCTLITCQALPGVSYGTWSYTYQPTGGLLRHGAIATLSCYKGYQVSSGSQKRTCSGSGKAGVWSGDQPSCQAKGCEAPPVPNRGTRIGNKFYYPHIVRYQCNAGYRLEGLASIRCSLSGTWVGEVPNCIACPENQYKEGSNTLTKCYPCPANSHTTTTASTTLGQCLCDNGYEKKDGKCYAMQCDPFSPPANGALGACNRNVGGKCEVRCNAGYHRSHGEATRTCRDDKLWSGAPVVCTACPKNSYKSSATECKPCPPNSETSGPGNELAGCKCKSGFTGPPGSSCEDVDECKNGNGGCEQACVNTPGTFKCACNIPGFLPNAEDPKKCVAKNQCPAAKPPDNGGLVCLLVRSTNTQRCEVKCNPGYEHVVRRNLYEECGPNTNWRWSYGMTSSELLPCVEAFFPGVQLMAQVAYFVTDCNSLTSSQKEALQQQFIDMLKSNGICISEGKPTCDVENVTIACGEKVIVDVFDFDKARFKRSASQELKVHFSLGVKKRSFGEVNCKIFCGNINLTSEYCINECKTNYKAQTLLSVEKAADKMDDLFNGQILSTHKGRAKSSLGGKFEPDDWREVIDVQPSSKLDVAWEDSVPALRLGGTLLFPSSLLKAGKVKTVCDEGLVLSNDNCVAMKPSELFSMKPPFDDKWDPRFIIPRPDPFGPFRTVGPRPELERHLQ